MHKKNILITGANGLVGSEAISFFLDKGWDTVGIDNNERVRMFSIIGNEDNNPLVKSIDITNQEELNKLFSENKFEAIIHAAAAPSHDWSKDNAIRDFQINAYGTLILLEATRKYCPDAVFVFCSTDKVYGGNMKRKVFYTAENEKRFQAKGKAFDEKLSIDKSIHSLFGCSKAAADLYVQEYGYYFGMKTACFRLGCITGRRHKGAELHGFLSYLVKCIKEGIPYKIFGFKGKQVRDQIHSYDLVNAFWHFIQNPKVAAVYNMGGGF